MRTMTIIFLCALAFSAHSQDDRITSALAAIRPRAIGADMRFLADDLLEGRGTGARGHLLAAHFMASQFEAMGLSGAGDGNSFYQDVPIRSLRVDEAASNATLGKPGQEQALNFREDYIVNGDPAAKWMWRPHRVCGLWRDRA